MRQSPNNAGNAAVIICSAMVTKVGKGFPRYRIKIVRVKITSIAPAKTSVALSKNCREEEAEYLTFNIVDLLPIRHFKLFYPLFSSNLTSKISRKQLPNAGSGSIPVNRRYFGESVVYT